MFSLEMFHSRICRGGSGGSGSSGGGGSVPVYQYANQPTADFNATAATSNLYNNPQAQNIYNQAQGSVGGIPQNNTGFDPQNVTQMGVNVQDAAAGLPYMGQQIYQSAFDPQQALFQQMQQQVTDQTNAQLSNQGLQGSPFAAGVMGQNLSGLDINWQNNLLNRETQGATAVTGLEKQYGDSAQMAAGLQFQGPQDQMTTSSALSGLNSQALGQSQMAIGDWLNYLQGGTQAAGTAASEQMQLNAQALQAQGMNMQANQASQAQTLGLAQQGLSGISGLMSGKGG
jgi:hypothetical protein